MESCCPFDLLQTDELVMKIINMALPDASNQHTFLVNTIAKISRRFRKLAMDKSFWIDMVHIKGTLEEHLRQIDILSQFPVKKLSIYEDHRHYKLSYVARHIKEVATKCPEVEELRLPLVWRWPTFGTWQWSSLRSLTITVGLGTFDDVELHNSTPNIMFFHIRYAKCEVYIPTQLPDMSGCRELEVIQIMGKFQHPSKVPFAFPRGLKKLYGYENILYWRPAQLKEHFDRCSLLRYEEAK